MQMNKNNLFCEIARKWLVVLSPLFNYHNHIIACYNMHSVLYIFDRRGKDKTIQWCVTSFRYLV